MKKREYICPPNMRQLRFPREFRIAAPTMSQDLIVRLEKQVRHLQECLDATKTQITQSLPQPALSMLADVGTSLWRMRIRMVDPQTGLPAEDVKRSFRHLQAALDALAEGGLEIVDHTGEEVPEAGDYMLRMVSFLPTEGLSRETVVETLKPTVRYKKGLIQIGEVIIGVPRKPEDGQG